MCQYKRMWHLPTIRSKMGTDQYSISLNVIPVFEPGIEKGETHVSPS